MLTHIVCWKYKESTGFEVRDEHRARLLALKDAIPEIIDIKVGADILGLERSFDSGLVATFADEAGLEVYTVHPDHQAVAALGKEIAERTVSVDFVS